MIKSIFTRIVFVLASTGIFAQDGVIKVGRKATIGRIAPGVPIIQIGFVRNDFINTHTVKKTKYIVFTWENNRWRDWTHGYYIEIAYPRVADPKTDEEFGWSGYKKDIGLVDHYTEKVSYFDAAVRVYAYDRNGDIIRTSQIRLVKQK